MGLQPYQPQRLLYAARLQGFRLQRALLLRQAGLDVPLPDPGLRDQGVAPEHIHLTLDVSPYLSQKLASMRCHQTQLTPDWAFEQVPQDIMLALLGQEYFIQGYPLASSRLSHSDMFLGILS
jgi:LmbE family N-acetylglucosaminyl deacetylase